MKELQTRFKVDITSKPLEILVETAKGFLEKIINPPLEELGLLFSEQVKYWRFKNQINTIVKAEAYLKEKKIEPKKISLKVLVPLLEFASLEEDETLQEKWAALLSYAVSNNEGNSSLFSYILSQVSKKDANIFNLFYKHSIDGDATLTIYGHKKINVSEILKNNSLEIDNLHRLNLIKPVSTHGSDNVYVITTLGVSFIKACTL